MKSHFVFLQAAPNAGVMQIVILAIFICVVLVIIKSFKNKKSHAIDLNPESSLENNTNSIIQAAGFELMKAGKNLITVVIILICLFPANIIIISINENNYFVTYYKTLVLAQVSKNQFCNLLLIV